MAGSLPLPTQILVHGHWTRDGQKMSKSKGNVVSPSEILESFHADIIRYYMMREGAQENDGNWNTEALFARNTYLANTYGNLLSRTLTKYVSLRKAVAAVFVDNDNETGIPIYVGVESTDPEQDRILIALLHKRVNAYQTFMDKMDLQGALMTLDDLWEDVSSSIYRSLTF
jgi:methionyl-tRNA synthetase